MKFQDDCVIEPVFLLGSHKSGSSLLRSLLDGHDQLAVLPKETHFFQFTNHWVDYALRRQRPRPYSGDVIDRLITSIKRDTEIFDPHGDAPSFKYDLHRLKASLGKLNTDNKAAFFYGYMRAAYEASTGTKPNRHKTLVEKSVEHAEFAYILRSFFPLARFIHIVRNPYATMVAIRKSRKARRYPFMGPIAAAMENSYRCLFQNRLGLDAYVSDSFRRPSSK